MNGQKNAMPILVADDDSDDRLMIRESFQEIHLTNPLVFVEDGEELMDYLKHKGKYEVGSDLPGLILLDLNMPKKDGREALQEIKSDPELRGIPIIVFTTSKAERDIQQAYKLGVNSFITKPLTFDSLVETVKVLTQYWFGVVELPKKDL